MIIKKHLLLFVALLFVSALFAQISTNPVLPIANQAVSITLNTAEDSRLGFFTGDLYAHTGVGIEGKGNWQNVIGAWNNNSTQPKLTHKGNGIYELEITPDINTFYSAGSTGIIYEMCFVFRSADGSQQTNDLFVDVFQPGLAVNIEYPNTQAILELETNYTFKARSTEEANLTFELNGESLASATGTYIEAQYVFENGGGKHTLVAVAENSSETVSDTIEILVRAEAEIAALPLGAIKGITYPANGSVRLVLWAPHKEFVFVLCEMNDWSPQNEYQMKKDGDYFWIEIDGLETGKEYPFQYYIDGEIKIADPYTHKILDPEHDRHITPETYPGLIPYPTGKTEGIVSIFHPGREAYQWQNPTVTIPPKEQMVIYELLIRDFTEEHTYIAVREQLDYLENLNVNVLELLPVNEFDANSSWGYNPTFFFAADKYYGQSVELKKLIDECHARGIAVVIDMVLNHSWGLSPFVQMYMDNWTITPENPWYNVESNFQNTGLTWGYDFNHDSEATRELVDSINSFWINEFKVDGFRFDFTKGFSNTPYGPNDWGSAYDADRVYNLKRMADEIWKRKPGTLVILEHLADNSEEKELANYGMLLWGNMNHNYGEAAMGYNEAGKSNLSWGYYANRNWEQPNLVTYQESHDEERLAYKTQQWGNSSGTYNIKNIDVTLDRLKLTSVFHLPLPGPKMIWQFGELGYDFSIDHNGRTGEKPIKWDYVDRKNRAELFKTMAALNHIKQTYDEFTASDVSLSLNGAVKSYRLSKDENHVVAVGNFDVVQRTSTVSFPRTGTWYNYFGQKTFSVTAENMEIELEPGEYMLLTSREMSYPDFTIRLSAENIENIEIKAYPNPASNRLNISGAGVENIKVFDTNGRLVLQQTGKANNETIQFDMAHLKQGIYNLVINNTHTGRFMKL
jgi:1,4-alpha-glucan branching enzyme